MPIDPPTHATSDDNYIVHIDSDGDGGTNAFVVDHDGGGSGLEILKVQQNGTLSIYDRMSKFGTLMYENVLTTGECAEFKSGTSTVAMFRNGGLADFSYGSNGGVKLPVVTSDPNGSRTGGAGEIIIYEKTSTGEWFLCLNYNGSTGWKKSSAGT